MLTEQAYRNYLIYYTPVITCKLFNHFLLLFRLISQKEEHDLFPDLFDSCPRNNISCLLLNVRTGDGHN